MLNCAQGEFTRYSMMLARYETRPLDPNVTGSPSFKPDMKLTVRICCRREPDIPSTRLSLTVLSRLNPSCREQHVAARDREGQDAAAAALGTEEGGEGGAGGLKRKRQEEDTC